jgi:hypothetical protein
MTGLFSYYYNSNIGNFLLGRFLLNHNRHQKSSELKEDLDARKHTIDVKYIYVCSGIPRKWEFFHLHQHRGRTHF